MSACEEGIIGRSFRGRMRGWRYYNGPDARFVENTMGSHPRTGRLALVLLAACTGAPDEPPSQLAIACRDDAATFYTAALPALSGPDTRRGEVLRCATDRAATAEEVDRAARGLGYEGPALASGV